MAIPIYQDQLKEQGLPGPRMSGNSADAYGASVFKEAANFGVALGKKIDEFEDAETLEAANNFRIEMDQYHQDPKTGILNTMTGKNAIGMSDAALGHMTTRQSEIRGQLRSYRAQKNFDRMTAQYIEGRHRGNMAHETQHVDAYELRMADDSINLALETCGGAFGDQASFDAGIERANDAIYYIWNKNGLDQSALVAMQRQFYDKAFKNRIVQWMDKDPAACHEWLYGQSFDPTKILNSGRQARTYNIKSGGYASTHIPQLANDKTEKNISRWDNYILKYSEMYGVDPNLVRAIIHQESRGVPGATNSTSGAAGLMQLMPGTAKRFGVTDRYDPEQNIMGGVRYLAHIQSMPGFAGRPDLVAAAYFSGENLKSYARGEMPDEKGNPKTHKYRRDVMGKYDRYTKMGGGQVIDESAPSAADEEFTLPQISDNSPLHGVSPSVRAEIEPIIEQYRAREIAKIMMGDPRFNGPTGQPDGRDFLEQRIKDVSFLAAATQAYSSDWQNAMFRNNLIEQETNKAQSELYQQLLYDMVSGKREITDTLIDNYVTNGQLSAGQGATLLYKWQTEATKAAKSLTLDQTYKAIEEQFFALNPQLIGTEEGEMKVREHYWEALGSTFHAARVRAQAQIEQAITNGTFDDALVERLYADRMLTPSDRDKAKTRGKALTDLQWKRSMEDYENIFKNQFNTRGDDKSKWSASYGVKMTPGFKDLVDGVHRELMYDLAAIGVSGDPNRHQRAAERTSQAVREVYTRQFNMTNAQIPALVETDGSPTQWSEYLRMVGEQTSIPQNKFWSPFVDSGLNEMGRAYNSLLPQHPTSMMDRGDTASLLIRGGNIANAANQMEGANEKPGEDIYQTSPGQAIYPLPGVGMRVRDRGAGFIELENWIGNHHISMRLEGLSEVNMNLDSGNIITPELSNEWMAKAGADGKFKLHTQIDGKDAIPEKVIDFLMRDSEGRSQYNAFMTAMTMPDSEITNIADPFTKMAVIDYRNLVSGGAPNAARPTSAAEELDALQASYSGFGDYNRITEIDTTGLPDASFLNFFKNEMNRAVGKDKGWLNKYPAYAGALSKLFKKIEDRATMMKFSLSDLETYSLRDLADIGLITENEVDRLEWRNSISWKTRSKKRPTRYNSPQIF